MKLSSQEEYGLRCLLRVGREGGDGSVTIPELSRSEGIIPALESAHAIAWVVREASALQGRAVLVNLSGRGDKDVAEMMERLQP